MFFWEIDVSLLFLGAVLAGMVAGFFVTGCVAGALLAWAYGKAKSGEHPAVAPALSGGSLDRPPMATSNSSTRGRVKFPQARTVRSVSQSAESLMARRWAASLSR